MANPKVKFKRSSVVGKVPGVSDLPLGEIAINTNDGIVYTAKSTDGGLTTSIVNISGIQIRDEGSLVGYANTLNFVGSGITVVSVSGGVGIISLTDQWITTAAGIHTLSNVGIGTTNPSEKLTVSGKIQISQDSGSNNRLVFRGQPGSSYRWNIDNYSSSNEFRIYREDDGTAANGFAPFSISTTGTLTANKFSGDGSLLTNLPTSGGSGSSQWVTTSAGIHTLSNVGIGTTNPSQKLEVVGGEIKAGRIDASSEGGQLSFGRATDNATAWYIDVYGNTSSPNLRFVDVSNAAIRAVIDGSGNFGLNTALPSSRLDVVGDAKISGVVTASSFSGNASSATYATTAGIATYATSSGIATYATTAGISTVAQGLTGTPNINVGVVTASQFSAGPYSVTSGILTTSSTSQVALVSYSLTSYRSAKLNIQVSYGSTHKITEILVIHNGTETFFTEYGTVSTIEAEFESSSGPTNLASFDSDINSGNFRILVTPGFSGITTFKYISNLITV
jgi:hypothetical protein